MKYLFFTDFSYSYATSFIISLITHLLDCYPVLTSFQDPWLELHFWRNQVISIADAHILIFFKLALAINPWKQLEFWQLGRQDDQKHLSPKWLYLGIIIQANTVCIFPCDKRWEKLKLHYWLDNIAKQTNKKLTRIPESNYMRMCDILIELIGRKCCLEFYSGPLEANIIPHVH